MNVLTPDLLVNTVTAGDQNAQQILTMADGSQLVIYLSQNTDGSGWGIFAQRFTPSGQRLGQETQLNQHAAGNQTQPRAALDGDGNVVLVYTNDGNRDGHGDGVFMARIGADLAPLGPEMQVNSITYTNQTQPDVAVLADGAIAVVWYDDHGAYYREAPTYQARYEVRLRVFEADGVTERVAETSAHARDMASQANPAIIALGDHMLVTWSGSHPTLGDGDGVYARILDANGAEIVATFRVNETTSGNQFGPVAAALSDGRFVIGWSGANAADNDGVTARVFDATGAAISDEITINTDTYSTDRINDIMADEAGGFVVAWHDYGYQNGENYTYGTFMRPVDYVAETGAYAAGDVTRINEATDGHQTGARLTRLADGAIGAVFTSDRGDGSGNATYLRIFGDAGAVAGDAAPVLEALPRAITVLENDGPQLIDPGMAAALSDADSTQFEGGRLVVGYTLTDAPRGVLGVADAGGITRSGDDVAYNGTVIGTVSGDGVDGRQLVIALNAGATVTAVEALVEALSYDITDDAPSEAPLTIFVSLEEASGLASVAQLIEVTIVAQPDLDLPAGPVRVTNTATDGTQSAPDVAMLYQGDGPLDPAATPRGYVTVWVDENGTDGDGYGVYGQRYDADGARIGDAFLVNEATARSQYQPSVTGLSDGGFVVAYYSDRTATGEYRDVMMRRFDADGVASPAVNLTYAGFGSQTELNPDVTALAGGGWVVTWQSSLGTDNVHAQIFDASGASDGPFQVNIAAVAAQAGIRAAQTNGGDIVFVWHAETSGAEGDGDGWGVFSRRFGADGSPDAAGEVQVNSYSANNQSGPLIAALAGGGHVVAWHSDLQDGSGYGVYAQRYDASGAPEGAEFRVNQPTDDNQYLNAVVALADGGFAIGYDDRGWRDGTDDEVWI